MKIFVSGPMTGLPNSNREAFNTVASELKTSGHIVLNPAVHPDGLQHAEYMHMCYAMIDVADAICLLKDWDKSKGSRLEIFYAARKGKMFTDDGKSFDKMVFELGECAGKTIYSRIRRIAVKAEAQTKPEDDE